MKGRLLNIALVATLIFESVAIAIVAFFWKNLQVGFHINPDNVLALAFFGDSLVLGFSRALVICLIPAVVLLVFSLALKVLHSKTTRFGPVEFEETTERVNEFEMKQQKLEEIFREVMKENKDLENKNRILAEELINIRRKLQRRK